MNEETQMVLLEFREYQRLKTNSENYLKTKSSSNCCSSCKDFTKNTTKYPNPSVTKEGFGDIKVPAELPSKYLDKPDIYVGATPEELQKEAGDTSATRQDNPSSKSVDDSIKVVTDSTPWYYIGKP